MAKKEDNSLEATGLKDIIAYAKKYGFVYQSSEIYGGLAAVYDYGVWGSELKNNLKNIWWKSMTQLNANVVGIDSSIFMHPSVWKASGHVDSFNDPMIDNLDSKKRYRADVLVEDKALAMEREGDKAGADALQKELGQLLTAEDLAGVKSLIERNEIVCPVSETCNWTDVRQFNLMFSTQMGSVADDSSTIYLRPETAQGIFVNFLNVAQSGRMKLPFGIAQIGKAFRNEIVAKQFVFRMREFEQMEMQFFVRPGEEDEWYEHWKANRMQWHKVLGIPEEKLRFHDHEKLAHYASAAADIEYDFPFGFKEVEGIHSRGDFDLTQHQEHSRKKQIIFDNVLNKNVTPFVVETSIGVDRLFLMTLFNAYCSETTVDEEGNEKSRTYLKLHPALAPIKAAILPVVKKDGLPEIGKEIFEALRYDFNVLYDDAQTIGKRYTLHDQIGTPYAIAIDTQSKEDGTFTIRYRDTMEQERINLDQLREILARETGLGSLFKKM